MRWITLAACLACAAARAAPACVVVERTAYAPWVFFGYLCASTCLEQKAGFAWADRQGIADADACISGGRAFVEGCRAYAESAVTAEQAGFEWARENELADACACGGAGRAFGEGCSAYVESVGE
jgi:hypothetical protein